jgi:hypothetical protein
VEVPACLRAPEVYAALVDVEHTEAGRGMQPEPTYPPRPTPHVDDWRDDPVIRPVVQRYPVLRELLDREGVNGLYRWAQVPAEEADAYGLHTVGLTDRAVGELMDPPRNELTVRALIGRAEERILDALARWERLRREMAEAM